MRAEDGGLGRIQGTGAAGGRANPTSHSNVCWASAMGLASRRSSALDPFAVRQALAVQLLDDGEAACLCGSGKGRRPRRDGLT